MKTDETIDFLHVVLRESLNDELSFEQGTHQVETQTVDTVQAVRDAIVEFCASHDVQAGWIQTTSAMAPFDNARVASGAVLCAELASSTISLSVRQASRGWLLVRCASKPGDGLIQVVRKMGRKPFGYQVYELCWQLTPQPNSHHQAYTIVSSRLLDMEQPS